MRKLTVVAALALAGIALPAAAMTPGQASCPTDLAPAGLAAMAAKAVLSFDEAVGIDPKLDAALDKLTKACIAREQIASAKQDDYSSYVMSRLIYSDAKQRLEAQSISTKVIEDAFDIGLGRRNPKSADLDKDAFARIMRKMKEGGVDVSKLSDQALNDISIYVVTAADMYRLAGTI